MKKRRSPFLLEKLEPRLLFSADLALLPVDVGALSSAQAVVLNVPLRIENPQTQDIDSLVALRREIVFIDTGVENYQQLLDDLQNQPGVERELEIILLSNDRDGIEQISDSLRFRQDISAVHIVSHGSDGEVLLGDASLNLSSLDSYAAQIESWQTALDTEADLLFYGCNLAAGAEGQALLGSINLLTGADVAASDDLTGAAILGGDWDLEYSAGTIETTLAIGPQTQAVWASVLDASNPLWLTTDNHVTAGGQPGTDTWRKADLVQMTGGPSFGTLTTGSFSIAFNGDAFAPDKNVTAVHFVSADIQLGSSNFQLKAGDLLLVSDATDWTGNSLAPNAGFTNSLSGVDKKKDVVVFRPDTFGDYSIGSFAQLLDAPASADLKGVTLIEQDTRVGDADLQAGDFLFTRTGGAEDNDVWLYQVTDVGLGTTSGSAVVLLEGADIGGLNKLGGIDLVETTTILGGKTLNSGTLLLNIDAPFAAGLPVNKFDIFALDVTATTLVGGIGNGSATASMFFEGGDVAFESGAEQLDGFTLTLTNNLPPSLSLPGPPLSYTVNDPATVIDATATVSDADSTNLDGGILTVSTVTGGTGNDELSILPGGTISLSGSDVLVSGVTIGTIDAVNNGIGGLDLVIHWNANSSAAGVEAVLRQISYRNTSTTPDMSTRVNKFALSDGDGGISDSVQQTVNFSAGNQAPVISLPGAAVTFTENGLPVILDSGALLTDDDINLNGGVLTVSINVNKSVNDLLSIEAGGNVSLSGSDILVSSTIAGSIDAVNNGTGGKDLVINWKAGSTPGAVQQVLRQTSFSNSSEAPSGLARKIILSTTDGAGGSSLAISKQVNVNSVNDAPNSADKTVSTNEEIPYTFATTDFGFTDILDNDGFNAVKVTSLPSLGALTLNSVNVNTGDFISETDISLGLLQYTPPLNGAGAGYASFTFQVQDTGGTANGGVDLSTGNTITIDITNINDAPTITSTEITTVTEDSPYSYTFAASDVDTIDTLTLSAPLLPSWLSFNASTGLLSGTPTNAEVGVHNVTLRVNDGTVDVDQSFTITVTNTNDAPTITSTEITAATEDTAYSYNFTATDVDLGDNLTLSAPVLPSWLSFDTTTGVLSGTPTNAQVGVHNVTLRVNDGTVNVDQSFTITVTNTNDLPIITSTEVTTVAEDSLYSYTFAASDVDVGNALTLSAPTLPSWLTFNASTGILSGTPTNAEVGDHNVVLRVNDGTVNVDQSFTITVTNTNDAPTIIALDNLNVPENTAGVVIGNLSTTDIDAGDTHAYSINDTRFEVFAGQLKLKTGQSLDFETEPSVDLIVTSTDAGGMFTNQLFTLAVNDINENPVAANDTLTVQADTPLTLTSVTDLLINDTDGDGDSLSLSAFTQPANGTLVDNGDGTLTYTPNTNFSGADSFNYTISDGKGGTASGTALINVAALPVIPTTETPVVEPDVVTDEPTEIVEESTVTAEPAPEQPADIQTPNEDNTTANNIDNAASTAVNNPFAAFSRQFGTANDNGSSLASNNLSAIQSLSLQLQTTPLEVLKNAWDTLDISPLSVNDYNLVRSSFDAIKQEVSEDGKIENVIVSSAIATSMGLSAGYVIWMLKGGSLLASVISSMPAWRLADPLSILSGMKDDDEDEESLESIISEAQEQTDDDEKIPND